MQFQTDHHFRIGHAHLTAGKACQDYAISGVETGFAYAIVSDGCSSGGLTDVGARLVAHQKLAELSGGEAPDLASFAAQLKTEDLLATCVTARCTVDGCDVRFLGDGAMAVARLDGAIDVTRVTWADNTPFYPAYRDGMLGCFIARHAQNAEAVTMESWDRSVPGARPNVTCFPVENGIAGIERRFDARELEDVELIAVFSDGVGQIEGVEFLEAVHQLMAFKAPAGRFAARRMNRFIKDIRRTSNGPIDDIAMAVIRVEHV